jgi:hypothetical protein
MVTNDYTDGDYLKQLPLASTAASCVNSCLLRQQLPLASTAASCVNMQRAFAFSLIACAAILVMSSVLGMSYEGAKLCSYSFWMIVLARTAALILESVGVVLFLKIDDLTKHYLRHYVAASVVLRIAFIGALLVFVKSASECRAFNAKAIFMIGIVVIVFDALICCCCIFAAVFHPKTAASIESA